MNNDDKKHQDALSPAILGEESISGDTPDPESDDNVLDAAHDSDLYKNADEEHPAELNVAEEIEKAENAQ